MFFLILFLGGLLLIAGVSLYFIVRFLNMKNGGGSAPLVYKDYDGNKQDFGQWKPHVNDPKNPFNDHP